MNIRDIVLFAVVFGGVPFILKHPYVGVLYWMWLGIMNPQRLTWGAAFDFPFSLVVAVTTALGVLFTRDERRFKGGIEGVLLIVFTVWMSITTVFAFHPDAAMPMLERVVKIQVMVFVALLVLASKRHIHLVVSVLVLSVGFYGVKGGLFTLRIGGEFRVWGPEGSFIEDNNSLALSLVMIIPLMYYMFRITQRRSVKLLLLVAAGLSAAATLGSHSRGALLAIAAMSFFLWLKSPGKILSGVLMVTLGAGLLSFMPESWWDRMGTIQDYEQDSSAMGRINAWQNAFNIAKDRVIGGGFELYWPDVFARYAPKPNDVHAAHSIYFQVLGEHGFIGLFMFMLIWYLAWRCANKIKKAAKGREDWHWAHSLASMIQVSFVGYAVGGAFLNLAYWDLPYYELVVLLVMRDWIRRAPSEIPVAMKAPVSSGPREAPPVTSGLLQSNMRQ
jgi:probable O-glycosylation ligase (exosortase A-associated)